MFLMLLSLTPFAAFTLLGRLISIEVGVWAGVVIALGLVLSDWLRPDGSIKMIEAGSFVLFGAVAIYGLSADMYASRAAVRAVSNGGLLAISLFSLAIGKPFTLQYSREMAPQAALASPRFRRLNYVITGVWTAMFAVMTAASVHALLGHGMARWIENLIVYAALAFGVVFTVWYVERADI